jgi:hypothetical protein
MNGGTQQAARVMEAVQSTMRPFDQTADDAAVKAWRALDSFTSLSAAQLRQNPKALIEMSDMLRRAMIAAGVER